MCAQHQDTQEQVDPTRCLPSPVEDSVPEGAAISDDDSVISSVCSQHSEPEGEFRDDYDDGIVHIPQPPPAPNTQNEGAVQNIIPEGDPPVHAPEGAAIPPAPNISTRTRWRACQYPPAKWMRGADGKLEGMNLSELKQQKAETYSPVVQWTMSCFMFILEILLGLKSMQGDVTCAFLHADLEENKTVYVDVPMGFAQYG
jgi:hypothetical protein